jgi:hypothetical protein
MKNIFPAPEARMRCERCGRDDLPARFPVYSDLLLIIVCAACAWEVYQYNPEGLGGAGRIRVGEIH